MLLLVEKTYFNRFMSLTMPQDTNISVWTGMFSSLPVATEIFLIFKVVASYAVLMGVMDIILNQ